MNSPFLPLFKYRFILKTVKKHCALFSILPHWWKVDNSFKTLTANWPTDANETWWQNGDDDDDDDDDDVDNVDNKGGEEEEEEEEEEEL